MTVEDASLVIKKFERNDCDHEEEKSIDKHEFEKLCDDLTNCVQNYSHVLVSLSKESKDLYDCDPSKIGIDKLIAERDECQYSHYSDSKADDVAFTTAKVAVLREVDSVDQTSQHDLQNVNSKTDIL